MRTKSKKHNMIGPVIGTVAGYQAMQGNGSNKGREGGRVRVSGIMMMITSLICYMRSPYLSYTVRL